VDRGSKGHWEKKPEGRVASGQGERGLCSGKGKQKKAKSKVETQLKGPTERRDRREMGVHTQKVMGDGL